VSSHSAADDGKHAFSVIGVDISLLEAKGREVWREGGALRRGTPADLQAGGFFIYKGISANPLVAAFTRGLASNRLVNKPNDIIYKGISSNHLVNGSHNLAAPCRSFVYKVLQGGSTTPL